MVYLKQKVYDNVNSTTTKQAALTQIKVALLQRNSNVNLIRDDVPARPRTIKSKQLRKQ